MVTTNERKLRKMRKKMPINKKILIVLIAAAFLLAAFFYFFPLKRPSRSFPSTQILSALPSTGKSVMPIPLTIHEGHGHIVDSYKAKDEPDKIIIHIQDIHTNYEAQKNMAMILEGLIKEKGLKLIMVEGGWGDVSLSYLRTHADKERRVEVAEEYLEEGKISGEEYLNIISDYDMDLQGIEREELYKKNLDSFFTIEKFRGDGTQAVEQLNKIVESLKQKTYPSKLLEVEKRRVDYDEEEITLAGFYDYLTKIAKDARLDTARYQNFTSFINIARIEEEIDFPKVEKQRAAMIESLSKILSKEKLSPLVSKSLEFRLNKVSPAEYHAYLKEVATEAGLDFQRYSELAMYVDYIQSHESINTNALFKEADEIERKIKTALAKTEEQRKIQAISRTLKVLDNFLNLKLIPEDFKYYKDHKEDFLISSWTLFLKEEMRKHRIRYQWPDNVAVLDKNLYSLVGFYDIANRRDQVFVKKAISLMEEKEQKLAVLIAGGFHTPNLTKMFEDKEISYIIIAPKTTQKTDPEQYRYILQYKSGRTE